MGDRTTVHLVILRKDAHLIEDLISENYGEEDGFNADPLLIQYRFDEVNYGDLPFLPTLLSMGIPYDSDWGRGDEYGEGTESLRLDLEGKPIEKAHYAEDAGIPVSALLPFIDSPTELRNLILTRKEELSVLPWDDQEANAKLYRMRSLIGLT